MLAKFAIALLCACAVVGGVSAMRDSLRQNFTFTSFGESGAHCTRQGRKCIANANCVANKCVCPVGERGPAQIECFKKGERLCYIAGDPHINGFGHARADVALPCRFRATRFVTKNVHAVTDHGTCAIEIFATNQEHYGRYAVRSVSVSVGITDPVTQQHTVSEIYKEMKEFSVNDSSIYQYMGTSEHRDSIWGSAGTTTLSVHPGIDDVNNFALIEIPNCEVRVKYRAFDPRRVRGQKQMPGLTIQAPVHAQWIEGFGSYPEGVCGIPQDTIRLYQDRAVDLGLENDNAAILYDVLSEAVDQGNNRNADVCNNAFQLFQSSPNQVNDVNACAFILTRPSVNRCIMEKTGSQAIDAFNGCLARQQGSPTNCAQFQAAATRCGAPVLGSDWAGPDASAIVC